MDIKEYEKFCKNSKYGNFMQSADWAKVKKVGFPSMLQFVMKTEKSTVVHSCL